MVKNTVTIYLPFPLKPPRNKTTDIFPNILWLHDMGLVKNIEKAKLVAYTSAEYIRCCYPDMEHVLFRDVVDFASWNCIIDDIMEGGYLFKKTEEKIEFLSTVKFICEQDLEHVAIINDPQSLITSFVDVKGRIKKNISTENYTFLMASVSHFMSGIIWEISSNYSNKVIKLNAYCAIKTASVGVLMAYALSLAIRSTLLNDAIINKKEFVIMMNCILLVMAIDNDLYSFNKEKINKEKAFNIIDVIQHELNVDLFEAISKTISLRNILLSQYIKLRNDMSLHSDIKCYQTCFEDLISGNVYFGNTCERYTKTCAEKKDFNMGYFSSASYRFEISANLWEGDIKDIIDLIPSISWWLKI